MDFIDWSIFVTGILALICWSYTTVFYELLKQGRVYDGTHYLLKYTHGFLIFSQINWLIFTVGMIVVMGWKFGFLFALAAFFFFSPIAGITTNQLFRLLKVKADITMMLFCLLLWVQVALLIVRFFI